MMGPSAFTAIRSLRRDQMVTSAEIAKGAARRMPPAFFTRTQTGARAS
jgi:hypothetical protein